FIRTLAEKAPTYREDFMTIAEQLEAKGEARGIQLGKQEGYQLGRQDAIRQLAKQLFANGVDRQIIKISTGLTDDELNILLV
ncbi:MAG TPA: ISNCY family transposase, partial [Arsenophonus nasoniae]